jgi:hypothetical protein
MLPMGLYAAKAMKRQVHVRRVQFVGGRHNIPTTLTQQSQRANTTTSNNSNNKHNNRTKQQQQQKQ